MALVPRHAATHPRTIRDMICNRVTKPLQDIGDSLIGLDLEGCDELIEDIDAIIDGLHTANYRLSEVLVHAGGLREKLRSIVYAPASEFEEHSLEDMDAEFSDELLHQTESDQFGDGKTYAWAYGDVPEEEFAASANVCVDKVEYGYGDVTGNGELVNVSETPGDDLHRITIAEVEGDEDEVEDESDE